MCECFVLWGVQHTRRVSPPPIHMIFMTTFSLLEVVLMAKNMQLNEIAPINIIYSSCVFIADAPI